MNDKFDELAKGLGKAPSRKILCLGALALLAMPAHANDFRLGPTVDLSDPDALAACDFNGGSNGAEKECSIVANPTNPKNMVVAWIGGSFRGIGAGVSLDGGKRWQQVLMPGLSICNGGTRDWWGNADPWLSFAPNGDLYHLCLAAANNATRNGVLVSKSTDGGLHWASPVVLWDTTDRRLFPYKSSITADPTDARFVYAIWDNCDNGNRGQAVFTRTTDGGRTWEPARTIYNPGTANNGTIGHIVNVLPSGVLVDVFTEFKFADGGTHKGALLSAIHSMDKGQTWSLPVRAAAIPVFSVIDPETGVAIVNSSSCCPNPAVAMDARNGNLYAVWEETGFSNGHYSSIAFAMSADGGFTWSVPIQVNKPPANVAPANRQAFIPQVAVAGDGTIGVTYYDFRFNDPGAGMPTDYWLVHCHPSARTPATNPASWGNEVRLTDNSFNIEKAPTPFGTYFIGDYEGLATVGSDFLAAWSQPHDTDSDSIFFRRVGP